MTKKEENNSLGLESSMKMEARLMTIESYLRHSEVIKKLDKERQKKSFNLNKWNEDMQKNFKKKSNELYKISNFEILKKGLKNLSKEMDEFHTKFFEKRKEIDLLEIEYKQLYRENKNQLLNYVISLKEKLRNENHEIEQKLIEENLKIKREKLKQKV